MKQSIRGSDVFVKEDLRAILDALDIAARHQQAGQFAAGWLAATAAMRTAIGIDVQSDIMEIHEITEYRQERIARYAQPPTVPAGRQFKIVGEREEWPAPPVALARPEPVNMTGDDSNVTVFNPAHGRLVTREIGHAWFGNDGTTTYWNASEWQRVPPEEYERWGELLPEGWAVLVRHAYANAKRRQVTANNRGLLR